MGEKNKSTVSAESVVNKYHIWDARRISELLPDDEFVDATVTSPPYWDLKNYGSEPQIGYGQKYDQYLDDLEGVFASIYDVTNKRGSLWIISDTIKYRGKLVLLPFDLAGRLDRVGWILQDIIIWNKDRTLPWSHQGKLRNIFEYIAFYSKGKSFEYHLDRVREVAGLREWWVRYPERYSPEGKAPTRTWFISIPRQGSWGNNWVRHFNPLPPKLVERILSLATDEGDTVLDPFSGSGTVLAQAHVMGRDYIGLDLNPSYKEMFEHQVLPAIRTLHQENREEAEQIERNRKAFRDLIVFLRKTKYPKELVRLYRKEYQPIGIQAVLALQGTAPVDLDIAFFFPRSSSVPPEFLPRATELCQHPPLSKYGIKPVLAAYSLDVMSERWLANRGLDLTKVMHLYIKGRTYAWTQRMSAESLLEVVNNNDLSEYSSQRYPPIISDIDVKVDPKSPVLPGEEK